jgi:hypothetical protein
MAREIDGPNSENERSDYSVTLSPYPRCRWSILVPYVPMLTLEAFRSSTIIVIPMQISPERGMLSQLAATKFVPCETHERWLLLNSRWSFEDCRLTLCAPRDYQV